MWGVKHPASQHQDPVELQHVMSDQGPTRHSDLVNGLPWAKHMQAALEHFWEVTGAGQGIGQDNTVDLKVRCPLLPRHCLLVAWPSPVPFLYGEGPKARAIGGGVIVGCRLHRDICKFSVACRYCNLPRANQQELTPLTPPGERGTRQWAWLHQPDAGSCYLELGQL